MSKPTPIIEAAAQAIAIADSGTTAPVFQDDRKFAEAALRSACPKEPPTEWIKAMRFWSFGRVPIPEMERQWRKQPLWLELWGDEP